MNKFLVSCVQNRATGDTAENLSACTHLVLQAVSAGAKLVCLPEFATHLNVDDNGFNVGAAPEKEHPAIPHFSKLAQSSMVWILLGSVAVIESDGLKRNRSVLIDDKGEVQCRYDKIHMFDVQLGNGEDYRESDVFKAGEQAVVAKTPFATLGLSICYDLRFAALYRLLAQNGAQILTVPAAFIHTTGKAHWQVLLRSRAIETGCYVVAPCQYGTHGSVRTYGHSMIIDPWGEVLAEGSENSDDVITAEIDLDKIASARARIPALQHDRTIQIQNVPEKPVRTAS